MGSQDSESINKFVNMNARKVKTKYDLNLILQIANLFVFGICVYLYSTTDGNNLVNIITIILVGLFAIENIGMLAYEKKNRNPFIIILVIVVTVFYMARVATILHIPASVSVYDSLFIPSVTDINNALIFILLANAAMFAGFYSAGKYNATERKIACEEDNSPKSGNAIIIIALVVLVSFFNVLNFELLGRLTGYIQTFLNRNTLLLFTFTMLAYHYNKISLKTRMLFIAIAALIVILITLSGSRSGILSAGMILLMGILAVKQRVMISKKIMMVVLLIIPISIIFFVTATYKQHQGFKDTITVQHLSVVKESEAFYSLIEGYLPLIYYRLGFLDYSTELMANRQKFSRVINGKYYAESIVDNILTPGLDVFGTPKASNALGYVRRGEPIPDTDQIMKAYQSDQMGIYGEYYVFFNGYPALAVFFFAAFVFQIMFNNLRTTNGLLTCIYRAVLLNLLYIWLNSFGFDWFVFDLVTIIITILIFARFYIDRGKRKFVFGKASKNNAANVEFVT